MPCRILPPYEFKRMGQSGTFALGDPRRVWGPLEGLGDPSKGNRVPAAQVWIPPQKQTVTPKHLLPPDTAAAAGSKGEK